MSTSDKKLQADMNLLSDSQLTQGGSKDTCNVRSRLYRRYVWKEIGNTEISISLILPEYYTWINTMLIESVELYRLYLDTYVNTGFFRIGRIC